MPRLSSCPPSSSGIPADHIFNLLPESSSGPLWTAAIQDMKCSENVPTAAAKAQDYRPGCLLWQPLLDLIFVTHFNYGFELWSSFSSARSINFFLGFNKQLSKWARLSASPLKMLPLQNISRTAFHSLNKSLAGLTCQYLCRSTSGF